MKRQMFKNSIDQSPKKYINDKKLERSCQMLLENRYTISEISLRLGYTSIHYFSKSFNMKYHMSPSEFVKQNLQNMAQCRKYSYSDRARYYIGQPEVVAAMNKLFDNLREYPIPMNMLHQYMPISYAKIREGQLKLDPRELAMDGIVQFMLDYESAV